MRKSLWFTSIVVIGALTGAAVLHASAQPGGNQGHRPPAGLHGLLGLGGPGSHQGPCGLMSAFHEQMAKLHGELNLTDAQRDAVHATFRARHEDIMAVVRPVLVAKQSLISSFHAETPDDTAIRASADRLGKAIGDAAVLMARIKADVLKAAALTPEQTRKLEQIRAEADASISRILETLDSQSEHSGK